MINYGRQFIDDEDIQVVYFSFEEQGVMSKLKSNLYKKFDKDKMLIFLDRAQDDDLNACFASAELIGRGWEKEALPIIQTKKSMISRLFSSFFE